MEQKTPRPVPSLEGTLVIKNLENLILSMGHWCVHIIPYGKRGTTAEGSQVEKKHTHTHTAGAVFFLKKETDRVCSAAIQFLVLFCFCLQGCLPFQVLRAFSYYFYMSFVVIIIVASSSAYTPRMQTKH